MAKRKPKATTKSAHPDADLISACIDFAIAMRSASGAFEADPTGNSDFAELRDGPFLAKADKAQEYIAGCKPLTMDGLRAKASIVDMALEVDRGSRGAFLRSLANDVVRFHRALTESKVLAANTDIALLGGAQ